MTVLSNVKLNKIEFKNLDLEFSYFYNCSFKNCFVETLFRSCKFINTSIEKSDEDDLMVTIIVDSTFGKSDKSLTFNGEFFLADILLPSNKIDDLLS